MASSNVNNSILYHTMYMVFHINSVILGYLFSRSNLPCLYAAALLLPYFHIEDVFMTGFVAEKCKIPRVGFNGYHASVINYTEVNPEDTLMHYITPRAKYQIHSVVIYQLFFKNTSTSNMF